MDDNKKRIIENTLVACFENRMIVRNISGSEKYECKTKEEIDKKKTTGVYLEKCGKFFSVLRAEGVLYFVNESEIFNVKESLLIFACKNIDDNRRRFEVMSNQNSIVLVEYDRIKEFEDNWSNEDDLDMFAWISNIYSKGRLDNILQY